jgi:hypothetical protein
MEENGGMCLPKKEEDMYLQFTSQKKAKYDYNALRLNLPPTLPFS